MNTDEEIAKAVLDAINSINEYGYNYKPKKGFRISSIATKCLRQIQLRNRPEIYVDDEIIKEIQEVTRNKNSGINYMVFGNLIHGWLQKNMPQDFVESIEKEVTYQDEKITLVGHYDMKVNINGQEVILEFKTTSRKARIPNDNHIKQLMACLKADNVQQGALVYVFRDTMKIKVIPIKYSDERFAEILQELRTIQEAEDLQILLPKISQDPEEFPCTYCEWKSFCHDSNQDDGPLIINKDLQSH